jgi:hypothetical protein
MAKRIPIIDDAPIIVDYLVDLFQDDGHETYSASKAHLEASTVLVSIRHVERIAYSTGASLQ